MYRRFERTLFHHRGCRRCKFAQGGLPVSAARFARQRPLYLPAILLAATDAVDRAAFEAAARAAGLVLEAEDDAHRGIARLFRSKLRIERLGERARRDQRAAVDRHGSARHPWAQPDRQAEYERSRDGTPMDAARSDGLRDGKEGASTVRSRRGPSHKNKNTK